MEGALGGCLHPWRLSRPGHSLLSIPRSSLFTPTAIMFAAPKTALVLMGMRVQLQTLMRGAVWGEQDEMGRTPLHWAAARGDAIGCKELLDAGCDWRVRDWKGWTAVHVASERGSEGAVDVLLAWDATQVSRARVSANVSDKSWSHSLSV